MSQSLASDKQKNLPLLTLAAMGVVYGDIGTSPIYALRECFYGSHALPVTDTNILGVLSLIFWSFVIIVSLKYLFFFLRADNRGEGGVLAMLALAHPKLRSSHSRDPKRWMIYIALFGAALLFGDGMITPAISVLSAVEGLTIATPVFDSYVLPIAVCLLGLLFVPQRFGTKVIGQAFGPIIVLWFVTMAVLGVFSIYNNPVVLKAVNPWYAYLYFKSNGYFGFVSLGTMFLAITGCEAMYADMGHFGKTPIRYGWFAIALPALVLNYLGQGALLISDHTAAQSPFFKLAPSWFLYPLVGLATMSAIIASQALITGTFSLTRQAIQLGYLPRLTIQHTSEDEIGQIYVPLVNWSLLIFAVWLVLTFKSSSNLAAAYGIAVAITMFISTLMLFAVARERWGWSLVGTVVFIAFFLVIDCTFIGANSYKIPHGGWFPLVIATVVFICMTTWRRGRVILSQRLKARGTPLSVFIQNLKDSDYTTVSGTALYMTSMSDDTPPALLNNLKHNKVIHEQVLLMTVETQDIPHVPRDERFELEHLSGNFYRIIVRYGFMDSPNIPAVLSRCSSTELDFKLSEISYFLGRETLLATDRQGMALWREKLFALMARNAQRATIFFKIPSSQVMEIGMQVEL